jgi:hypothetical protein
MSDRRSSHGFAALRWLPVGRFCEEETQLNDEQTGQ